MGDKGKGGDIKTPNFSKEYEKGLKVYLKYLPKQLRQELKYRQEYDPQFLEHALNIQHQYDPRLAKEQLQALERRDPQWMRAHETFGDKINEALSRGYIDPTRAKLYETTGQRATGDILRGTRADKDTLDQMTQAILSRSPNLSHGEAQDMASAVYVGQRGQGLLQQRQQAANQFLGQQSESDLALTAGGRYMSTPSTTQMLNQIGGVQAPSQAQYVYPGAGYQGVQQGNNMFAMNMAAQGAQGSGSTNPWMNALQGAASGASYGSVGGGYGAAGGAVTGAVAGAFGYPQYSDARLKTNISRTGALTRDGIPIVTYEMNGRHYMGVLAQDVERVRPDAVYNAPGDRRMVFYDRLGIQVAEIPQTQEKGVSSAN